MKGLPPWTLAGLAVLAVLLLVIGWDDRGEAGYVPFIMGVLFALFTLAAIGARVTSEDEF